MLYSLKDEITKISKNSSQNMFWRILKPQDKHVFQSFKQQNIMKAKEIPFIPLLVW